MLSRIHGLISTEGFSRTRDLRPVSLCPNQQATTYTGKYKRINIVIRMTAVIDRMIINKMLFFNEILYTPDREGMARTRLLSKPA